MENNIEIPRIGLQFDSYCTAYAFLKKYMDLSQEFFTIKTSNLIPVTEPYSRTFVYTRVVFACKRGGNNYQPKGLGLRETRYLRIVECDLVHTQHEPTGPLYKLFPENRRLSPEQLAEVHKYMILHCEKKRLRHHIMTNYGKFCTLRDLTNIKAKRADVSICKEKNQFKGLYFSTPDMKNSMNAWPEVVFIDGTYTLLDNNLTLTIVAVEDSNGLTNIVAIGLLACEDIPTFDWFIKTFIKNNQEPCSRIKSFMADKSIVERTVLKNNFKNVPVYICIFHTLQAVKRALQKKNISVAQQTKIFELFKNLAYSSSQKTYDQQYETFCKEVPAEILKYFKDHWFNCQEEWTTFNMKEENFNNSSNNRVESLNQKAKQIVEKRSSPTDFIKSLFIFITSLNTEIDYKAAENFLKIKTKNLNDTDLTNYRSVLTEKGFNELKKDWNNYTKVQIYTNCENKYFYKEDGVQIEVSENCCLCRDWSSMHLPCRHILATRKFLNLLLFSEELCHERWTKNYYRKKQRTFQKESISACSNIPLVTEIKSPVETEKDRLHFAENCMSGLVSINL
ncbi:Similar to Zswim3: Zinc finger SWIM domain-containing protein 3 (Mus musculus) [Cotesia congregata]|uniref:Similar to Zswim3: Zinc finger SWIM domain-containing protein 3 (Mus musculus) n=1 Tax=Cotesia congregata TaxID=51543 RepID=A0A8J2H6T5_COTCN|nr:Similar to Zswim3: Zinc finger SWIM domain-containing protein 3 (Mus musculus) [Cotesia congregata]